MTETACDHTASRTPGTDINEPREKEIAKKTELHSSDSPSGVLTSSTVMGTDNTTELLPPADIGVSGQRSEVNKLPSTDRGNGDAQNQDDSHGRVENSASRRRRSRLPADDAGLVSNSSLEENELDTFYASEAVAEEEERLRQEREAAANKRSMDEQNARETILEDKKFQQLEKLLNQSELFTQFLSEQINDAETKASEAIETECKDKGKRKSVPGAKPSNKKHKGDAPAEVTEALCPGFSGALRDYQLKGVKWLISLWQNGLNGILADQMGLGKTVQTIAFLCHMRGKGILGPYMVIGPLSTLPNWVAEFERWAPDFPVVLYHGSKQDRAAIRRDMLSPRAIDDKFPVVVTSYEIAIADIKHLAKYTWKYVIVDEGHRLKNMNCRLIRELRTLRAENKLLLTGTPLQNNLGELWSLLNFLLPEVFSSLENFESWFDFAASVGQEGADREIIAEEQRNKVISKLHAILKPFLLRRVKTDVETSLPGKMEVILYAQMTDKQREINQQLLDRTLGQEMAKKRGGGPAVAALNNMLMQMRKNANHPDLITAPYEGSPFYPPADQLIAESGKMRLLDRLLRHLFEEGHKVLIFSQMTSMLDLLDSYLDERRIAACRIDGSVAWQDRQASMKRFNTDPECKVFLLSTRAGGLGINLTAADTCIIYDSDWNPHQDLQAMDRCHRIGQQKPVLVLRLATAHSVEGKMLRRANSKLMLEKLVIKKGAFLDVGSSNEKKSMSMSADELLELLKSDVSLQDVPQSAEVDNATLNQLLDRTHLLHGKPRPYSESGPGYEVVQQIEGSGLLQGVE